MALRARRVPKPWLFVAGVLALLFAAANLARFYTDILWFREVGFASVVWTTLATQFGVGFAVAVVVAAILFTNLLVAARVAPPYRTSRFEVVGRVDPLDHYRDLLGPYVNYLRILIAGAVGLLAGLGASAGWQTFLMWANRVPFGDSDPEFGLDIGFYVFELPFYNFVLNWLWFSLIASLIFSVAAHFWHGSIRPEGGLNGVWPGALAHISVLLGLLALVKAVQYWIGRYELNFSVRGAVAGASYTDVNAHLPALTLLAIISIVSAGLFLVNIRVRRLSLPLAAVGLWILFSVLAGGVWPWWVQTFSVEPQELQREEPYIQRNLEATRTAFNLDAVETRQYSAASELTAQQAKSNQSLLENVRLWDPTVLQQAYRQLQAIRTYYQFPDVDIDRYEIDGETRQVMLSARELSVAELPEGSRTWTNQHLQYTHGFGLVASLANEQTPSGQPSFLVKDVPGTVSDGAEALALEQPRVYFGEAFEPAEYSVVDSQQEELDYETARGVERSSYQGEGGVPIGGYLQRLAFALRESDPNLLLSNLITQDSSVLIYRNVRDRVRRAAPFLALDQDPYAAVVDGELKWILDAYTSTPYYPYSQRFDVDALLGSAPSDGLTGNINYVRNSVKVVVDAYDGSMDFHVVDTTDPLIAAWRDAFPDLFSNEAPTEGLIRHFRYPADLFEVQSEVYLTYHMTEPENFYAKSDEWDVPDNRRSLGGATATAAIPGDVPPVYLLSQLPGSDDTEFVLTRPFTPKARPNMIAFMVAHSDPERYGELLTLEFPPQELIRGPEQVDNLINQQPGLSQDISLLDQRGSEVNFGALVILPIEDSILYVQPLFVSATNQAATDAATATGVAAPTGAEGIPEIYQVVLVLGDRVVRGDSFEEALSELFGGTVTEGPLPPAEGGPARPGDGALNRRLTEIVNQAGTLYDRAQRALQAGDFETYGRLIQRVGALLEEAEQLQG